MIQRECNTAPFSYPYAISVILSGTALLFGSYALADSHRWNESNHPARLDANYVYQLKSLPAEGAIAEKERGWADSYWPLNKGMIAYRYQTEKPNFDKEKSPSLAELKRMSADQIKILSPAEKLDLAIGRLDYPVTKAMRKDLSARQKDWRGVCNGWAQASIHLDEPNAFVFRESPLGIDIPFGSGDIKGLLAFYYARVDDSPSVMLGERCERKPRLAWSSKACSDVNAGAFHVVMANELGIRKVGFTADRDPFNEVWNQPYTGYKIVSQKTTKDRWIGDDMKGYDKDVENVVLIEAEVSYADDDNVEPSYEPFIKNNKNKIATVVYRYELELDVVGRIIGGTWLTDLHPDFIWKQQFNLPAGQYGIIGRLYQQSRMNHP
jgi:hypothetical protein